MTEQYYFYNDCDDRPLIETEEDMDDVWDQIYINENIIYPIVIINGTPYYND